MYRFTFCTTVRAPQPAVWEQVSTIRGVNEELSPLFHMTCPHKDMRISPALVGSSTIPLFRSWLFLFGLIPIEYDDINIVGVIEGKSFSERSSMALMTEWHHDRILETTTGGTIVTDELSFIPRFRIIGFVLCAVVKILFSHRHRRLISVFGCCKATVCQVKND